MVAAAQQRCELAASKVESARSWVGCVEGAVRTFVRSTLCLVAKKWPDNAVCLCLRVDNHSSSSSGCGSGGRRRTRRKEYQQWPITIQRPSPQPARHMQLIIAAAFPTFLPFYRRTNCRFHCRSPPVLPSHMVASNGSKCCWPHRH